MEIASGIHRIKVPIPDNPLENLNCYLVEGWDGWVMIDAGWHTPETLDSLKSGLKGLGIGLTDIASIVITHIHPDHFGLAGKIKELSPGTKLIMHRLEADLIESRYIKFPDLQDEMEHFLLRHGVSRLNISSLDRSSLPALEFVKVTYPEYTFYGGEIIRTGKYDLEVIWTPGHSIGHICLYEPQNQLLFAGDHIFPQITSAIGLHVQSGDNPLGDYLNSLHKIENLVVTKILPAHENIFTDLRGRIGEIKKHHQDRNNEILATILKKPLTAYEISPQIKWNISSWNSLSPLHKRLAIMEAAAHLEYLRWEGKVQRIIEKNVFTYWPR
jgi:glyoxylase-like metal-dependent hydrolase (beta-lactamase superfamily II)